MTGGAALAQRGRIRQRMGSSRELHVASGACGCNRQDRADRPLRIHNAIQSRGQVLLAPIDMAHRAIREILGSALWGHCREQRFAEIVVTATESDDRIILVVGLQVYTTVNPV